MTSIKRWTLVCNSKIKYMLENGKNLIIRFKMVAILKFLLVFGRSHRRHRLISREEFINVIQDRVNNLRLRLKCNYINMTRHWHIVSLVAYIFSYKLFLNRSSWWDWSVFERHKVRNILFHSNAAQPQAPIPMILL